MTDALDQIFVTTKQFLVAFLAGLFPPAWQPLATLLISAVVMVAAIIGVFATLFAITTVLERKGLGRMQNRHGPNRVGIPFTQIRLAGFGQPAADGIKALIKEDVVPVAADKVVHFLAPVVMVVPVILAYAVLPVGRNMVALDLDAGVLFFFAVGGAVELAVFMAGWSSRNKYALLGAMRAIAQMISYEIPLILAAVPVIMIARSLSTTGIIAAQAGQAGFLPAWFVFTPWGFAGFVLFMIAATAESNRSPFDLPEGESELVAGYFTEYSGFKFALFFLAEYLGLFVISGLAITLFLGGWHAPFPWLAWLPSWFWFFVKLLGLIFVFIWLRGTLPRLRLDQLMNFAWKFLLPLTLINLLTVAVWHYLSASGWRWAVCVLMVIVPYVALGRGLWGHRRVRKRVYRYAE
ncbi:MAG TPA: NADH-quinone oxidoreductase subunit NuoH [Verrucomicrobiota bacterium]|nr:NADH-quinone oxidoreductase subunit NuoH [Verrucomicrobiota bacterium]HPY31590.1 NADH-quinone oxidoreductase subunit NuoH [Verrucomicrobiota bacterium]HQB15886.1 NADH-quinone oxidoreductase subunit NuoH [Verrucomicrobiota bacterium]